MGFLITIIVILAKDRCKIDGKNEITHHFPYWFTSFFSENCVYLKEL